MPRPVSELTGQTVMHIRMSAKQKEMFKDLGGAEWLRKYLQRQIRQEKSQLGLSQPSSLVNNQNVWYRPSESK
jgi:hypothetical protein